MPVPMHKNTQSSYSLKEPLNFSANAAHFPSFCNLISILDLLPPNATFNLLAISNSFIPKFTTFFIHPSFGFPGVAIPILSI